MPIIKIIYFQSLLDFNDFGTNLISLIHFNITIPINKLHEYNISHLFFNIIKTKLNVWKSIPSSQNAHIASQKCTSHEMQV